MACKFFAAAAGLLLFPLFAKAQVVPEHISVLVSRGVNLAQNAQYDKALENFDKAIKIDPKSSAALYNRGIVYYKKSGFTGALADFGKACNLGNEEACDGAKTLGKADVVKCRKAMGDLKDAVKQLDKGNHAEALKETDAAIKNVPDCLHGYYVRARVNETVNPAAAIKDLDHVIAKDFSYSKAYYLKGKILRAQKQNAKAEELLNSAVKYDDANFQAYMERANLYNSTGRFDLAMKDFSSALEVDAKDYNAQFGLAVTYSARKDYANSMLYYEKACKGHKAFCEEYNKQKANPYKSYTEMPVKELLPMAEKADASGNHVTAFEYAKVAAAKDPKSYAAQFLAGKICLNGTRDYVKAISYFEAASSLNQNALEPKLFLTKTYFMKGDVQFSLAMANKIVLEHQDDWQAYDLRGGINEYLNYFDQASIDYNKAASLASQGKEKGRIYFTLYKMNKDNGLDKHGEDTAEYLTQACQNGYAQACKKTN